MASSTAGDFAAAIDLGGTWAKAGLVRMSDGAVVADAKRPTPQGGGEEVASALVQLLETVCKPAGGLHSVAAIGVGSPGMIDEHGVLHGAAVNIPGWSDLDLSALLLRHVGRTVRVLNDANAAAMGEYAYGAGRGHRSIVFLSVGTGVGCGLVIDGRPHAGVAGIAGELGHLVVQPQGRTCRCGHTGCLEAYVSAEAIRALTAELYSESDTRRGLEAEGVYRALRDGDSVAHAVHEVVCRALAHAVAILSSTIAPEAIIFGGGLSRSSDLILPRLRDYLSELVLPHVAENSVLKPAELLDHAGIVGAAAAALQ